MIVLIILGWIWAAPLTLVGLSFLLFGARWLAWDRRCLVFVNSGTGLIGWYFRSWKLDGKLSVGGFTFGNVIVLREAKYLVNDHMMNHEAIHAKQCMIFGVLQPVLYVLNWLVLVIVRNPAPYHNVVFERWARGEKWFG